MKINPLFPMIKQNLPQSIFNEEDQNLSLFQQKLAKKDAEQEALKIWNRIDLLKKEELKIQKKIEQTDIKAEKIVSAKIRHLEQVFLLFILFIFQKAQRKKQIEQPPPFSYQLYISRKKANQLAKLEEIRKKKIEARLIREENKRDTGNINEEKQQVIRVLKLQADEIKLEEKIANQNVNFKLQQKRFKVKNEQAKEWIEIQQEKEKCKKIIEQLEFKELEAIQSLQKTQNHQKDIIEKYKEAKKLNPIEFQQKYGTNFQTQQINSATSLPLINSNLFRSQSQQLSQVNQQPSQLKQSEQKQNDKNQSNNKIPTEQNSNQQNQTQQKSNEKASSEQKPPEQKPNEQKPNEQKPPEQKPPEQKPPEQKPPEQKPPEQKPPEQKPPEQKTPEQQPAQNNQVDQGTQANQEVQTDPKQNETTNKQPESG